MDSNLVAIIEQLDSLADAVESGGGDDRTLMEAHGWHSPPVNKHDLAAMARKIADRGLVSIFVCEA